MKLTEKERQLDTALAEQDEVIAKKTNAVLYHFIELYEEISAKETIIQDQAGRLEKISNEFKSTGNEFKKLSSIVREQLEMSLDKAVDRLESKVGARVEQAGKKAGERAAEALNDSSKQLGKAVLAADFTLKAFKVEAASYWSKHIKITAATAIAIGFLSGVAGSYLTAKRFLPTRLIDFDERSVATMVIGYELKDMWPKLPNDIQKQLKTKAGLGSIIYHLDENKKK